jgi:hypothetical protein
MAAALELEGLAETGQARPGDHHVQGRGGGDGGQLRQWRGPEGCPGGQTEPAEDSGADSASRREAEAPLSR